MDKFEGRVSQGAVALSCRLVGAYVASNAVPSGRLPSLIVEIHAALVGRRSETQCLPALETSALTAAQVQASLGPGGIRSFESGKRYASLRRHLGSLGLSPEAYRRKWGLPPDYPMVCPIYAARRSDIARTIGLGRPQAASPQA
ncbi:MucR family transcriptional regulator [Methylorubrum populi]|uniref:MucR family transcriptional regulator n=1 Tax=Methylobacterium radiotolerans TaxID=31998 RepID=A0ABU7T7G7_9HYPH